MSGGSPMKGGAPMSGGAKSTHSQAAAHACPYSGVRHRNWLACWQLLFARCLPGPGLPDRCFKTHLTQ